MEQFLTGAIAMAYWACGLFFLRFWRRTRDRLFATFAASFWMLGLIRIALVVLGQSTERATPLYWLRLAAYGLIMATIVDKNRTRPDRGA